MRFLYGLLVLAALVLASCNSDPLPTNVDWCYEFDFRNNDSMALTYGRWLPGVGYSTDENNNLGLTYDASVSVAPVLARVGIQKGAYGDLSVASSGTVFGINMENQATIPAAAPANTIYDIDFKPSVTNNAVPIGSQINVTVRANGNILVSYLQVYGTGANPFPASNCGELVLETPLPPPTSTNLPTSQPTWTPVVTDLPSVTPSPTPTTSPTPAQSPTPTPTPTFHYYWGPEQSGSYSLSAANQCPGCVNARYRANGQFVYDPDGSSSVAAWVGWITSFDSGGGGRNQIFSLMPVSTPAGGLPFYVPQAGDYQAGSSGDVNTGNTADIEYVSVIPANATLYPAIANWISTQIPSVNNYSAWMQSTPAGTGQPSYAGVSIGSDYTDQWNSFGMSGALRVRPVLYGYPSPTPTWSPTPTATPTATHTGVPTNQFTQTPAGPTFTPNPRATGIPVPQGAPGGNNYRGGASFCGFGTGNYVYDFRQQSAESQNWMVPFESGPYATWRQYVGMELALGPDGNRLGQFWYQLMTAIPGGTIQSISVWSPSNNPSWTIAVGTAPSRNPDYDLTNVSGPGWKTVSMGGMPVGREVFVSVRSNNTAPLTVSMISVNVSCPGTPTATQPFQVGQPPILPTVNNWQTPQPTQAGTLVNMGTPWGTPGGTPAPGSTPGGSTTPQPTTTSTPEVNDMIPGESGAEGAANFGGNLFGTVNNLFGLGGNWLDILSNRITGIAGAWNSAPVTAPPGVPLCKTNPQSNQVCAIFYFLRYSILSGPTGSLIMPLATVVFDLFVVFMFIRMVRAILARVSKVSES